jgi:GNAT superfamily N-acetyltransferase
VLSGRLRTGLGPEAVVEQRGAEQAAALLEEILPVYRSAFGAPPYRTGEEGVQRFAVRFPAMTELPGFECSVARVAGTAVGFAFGFTSVPGLPWRERIVAALSPPEAERWFADSFELVELAVAPEHQGFGIGGRVHDALLALFRTEPPCSPRWRDTSARSTSTTGGMARRLGAAQLRARQLRGADPGS